MRIFLPTLMLALFGVTATSDAVSEQPDDRVKIGLVAFNDLHGNLNSPGPLSLPDPTHAGRSISVPAGGVANLASLMGKLRARHGHTIVVGAGDMVGAAPLVSSAFRHEPTIEALNLLGLDLTAVGNHEFDQGSAELLRLQRGGCHPSREGTCRGPSHRFAGATFQYLAGNVVDKTGTSLLPGTAIREVSIGHGRKVRIGFIGIVTRQTPRIVVAGGVQGLSFLNEAATANRLAAELKAAGTRSIVLLIHEGITTDSGFNECQQPRGALMPILEALDAEIDVVVSGHTHRAYVCRKTRDRGKPLLYTSAGSYGRFVTDISLTVDATTGDVVAADAENLPVTPEAASAPALAANAPLQRLLDHYNGLVESLEKRVVGRIDADITRVADENGQTPLGRLVAEADLAATRDPQKGGAVAAFMNWGGIRADLVHDHSVHGERPGEITYGEAFAVLPMGNHLVTMTLTGVQLTRLLEQQPAGQAGGHLLQVSPGFTYRWERKAHGRRSVVPGSVRIDGVSLEATRMYRIAVNNFLASGGDGYSVLKEGRDPMAGPPDVDAFAAYLRTKGK